MDSAASSHRHDSKDDGISRHGAIRRLQVLVLSLSLCRLCVVVVASCLALSCHCFCLALVSSLPLFRTPWIWMHKLLRRWISPRLSTTRVRERLLHVLSCCCVVLCCPVLSCVALCCVVAFLLLRCLVLSCLFLSCFLQFLAILCFVFHFTCQDSREEASIVLEGMIPVNLTTCSWSEQLAYLHQQQVTRDVLSTGCLVCPVL
jgi:hypothetical protein